MRPRVRRVAFLVLLATLAGCAAGPSGARSTGTRSATRPPSPPIAGAQPAAAKAVSRWLVPYFTPLQVLDNWSPDGALTLATSDDREVFLYRAAAAAPVARLPLVAAGSPVWSPDGRLLAAIQRDRLVVVDVERRVRVSDVPLPQPVEGGHSRAALAGFLPHTRSVVVLGPDGVVRVVDSTDGRVESSDVSDLSTFGRAVLAPAKSWLAYNTQGGALAIFDLAQHVQVASVSSELFGPTWYSAGDRLAATNAEGAVVIQPGFAMRELPFSGKPLWSADATQLAFEGRYPGDCRDCLRPFGPTNVFDVRTGSAVRADDFVPDGPRFGAVSGGVQDRTTGVLRTSVPPAFELAKARAVTLEDEHTLLFDAEGWAARIDLRAPRVLEETTDGSGRVHAGLGLIIDCANDRFVVRQRFTGSVLGTLDRPCQGASLEPLAPPLYEYRTTAGDGNVSEVIDLGEGKVLARLTAANFASWVGSVLSASSGDSKTERCQLFAARDRSFWETPPFPGDARRTRCDLLAPGVIVAWTGSSYPRSMQTYVWITGRGFLAPDGSTTAKARSFCDDAVFVRPGLACVERRRRAQQLTVFLPGRPLLRLLANTVDPISHEVLSGDARRIAFLAGQQTYVGDFASGKITAWGPMSFVPRRFREDSVTLEGDIARIGYRGAIDKSLRAALVRDGREIALEPPAATTLAVRLEVSTTSPLTLLDVTSGRTLRLLIARIDGHAHVAAFDEQGHSAGDRELTRRFLYAQGSSPRDATLVTGAENAAGQTEPDLAQEFLRGQIREAGAGP